MKKNTRIALAEETLDIIAKGYYYNSQQKRVEMRSAIAEAIEKSSFFSENSLSPAALDALQKPSEVLQISLSHESTLQAAQRLYQERENPQEAIFVLNFASAKNAGGGFLKGAQAQEESLARASALYPCQMKFENDYYQAHRQIKTCLYSDKMIYSPNVPIFRDDEGNLLDDFYTATILTSPAVNAGVVRRQEQEKADLIVPTLRKRMEKFLLLAKRKGHRDLVLGAWGCGVFQNSPTQVAALFYEALLETPRFEGAFRKVVFAFYNPDPTSANFAAFAERFGSNVKFYKKPCFVKLETK
ncbi:TIGR02452 family protein [Hugenholtzia roseola]|uniref:TIGR02452 family protein n=1 Tax=Hugenholtzia roseola TaxID=1002 RepID=UPI00040A48C2|nr:TIGR02452 family protein [Hugenholtzia roseola]